MNAYRVSRARQFGKFWVAVFGRRRRPFGWQPPTPVRKYHRPSVDERLEMWRLASQGWSARQIARRLKRDHHTVLRAVTPHHVSKLVWDLARGSRYPEARTLAMQIGGPDLCYDLDSFVFWRSEQRRQRALLCDQRALPLMTSVGLAHDIDQKEVDQVLATDPGPTITDDAVEQLVPPEFRRKRRPWRPRRRRIVPIGMVYVTEPPRSSSTN